MSHFIQIHKTLLMPKWVAYPVYLQNLKTFKLINSCTFDNIVFGAFNSICLIELFIHFTSHQAWSPVVSYGSVLFLFHYFSSVFPEPDTSNNESHGDQENPDRVHEEVQGSQMGDVFQMLRGFAEVSSDPAGDGAFPQALVLGGLGQRLWLQRLVHAEADQEQSCPSIPPAAADVGGEAEVVQSRAEAASRGWRGRGGSRWGRCTDCRWGKSFSNRFPSQAPRLSAQQSKTPQRKPAKREAVTY